MKTYLVLFLLSVSSAVVAGDKGGMGSGGGDAVVCYDNNTIKSSTLLDLYEGQNIFSDNVITDQSDKTYNDYLELALKRLENTAYGLYGVSKNKLQVISLREAVKHIETKKRLISKSVVLSPINDSFEVFVPKNCVVAQAAAFVDEETILFDSNIWESMSELDKAGLILHEALYWYERDYTSKFDSRRPRRIVSLALSDKWEFENVLEGLPSTYTLCSASWENEPTVFAVYEKENVAYLSFFLIAGNHVISKKTAMLDTEYSAFLNRKENDFSNNTFMFYTNSKYEDQDQLQVFSFPTYGKDHVVTGSSLSMKNSHKTSYPAKDIASQEFRCQKNTKLSK